jgi:hypothetical protein
MDEKQLIEEGYYSTFGNVGARTEVYISICTDIYILNLYVYTYLYLYIYLLIGIYVSIQIYIYIYTYIYMYKHVDPWMLVMHG